MFWRIVVFYILGVLITGMLVPYDDADLLNGGGTASQSPYVIAIRRAGIRTLPSIINAAIFTSAFSAGNSFLFCASRILYGLSVRGQAPRVFTRCTSNGLPIVSVLFCVSKAFFFLQVKWVAVGALEGSCFCSGVFVVLLLPLIFYERVFRCGQSLQVRSYPFFGSNDLLCLTNVVIFFPQLVR